MKRTKNKKMLRSNGRVKKSVESVLRPEENLWWERFVKEVGFKRGVKEWRRYGWWERWVTRGRRHSYFEDYFNCFVYHSILNSVPGKIWHIGLLNRMRFYDDQYWNNNFVCRKYDQAEGLFQVTAVVLKNWWHLGNSARPTWFQTWYQIASFLLTLSDLGGHFTYCKALQMQ